MGFTPVVKRGVGVTVNPARKPDRETSYDRFVVVGCGRSGTRYTHRLFTELGLPCGHQNVFSDSHAHRWDNYKGDSSAFAAPYLKQLPASTLIIHQMRNPWMVVRSLVKAKHVPGQVTGNGHRFYATHCPFPLDQEDMHLRAATLWWGWNAMIESLLVERRDAIFQRLEEWSEERVAHILSLLGYDDIPGLAKVFKSIPTTVGSVQPEDGIPDLSRMPDGFHAFVERYGYSCP